jgi:hypothetical protein
VDGLVQLGGCRATLVHPTPGGRGHTAVGAFQGAPALAVWASPPLGSAVRAHRVPAYKDRGGVHQSLSGPPASHGSSG